MTLLMHAFLAGCIYYTVYKISSLFFEGSQNIEIDFCPVCSSKDTYHRSTFVSAHPVNSENARSFCVSIFEGHWDQVSQYCFFDAMEDNFVFYMLECHDGTLAWFLFKDPFELFTSAELVTWNKIDSFSSESFREAYKDKNLVWHEFLTEKES